MINKTLHLMIFAVILITAAKAIYDINKGDVWLTTKHKNNLAVFEEAHKAGHSEKR